MTDAAQVDDVAPNDAPAKPAQRRRLPFVLPVAAAALIPLIAAAILSAYAVGPSEWKLNDRPLGTFAWLAVAVAALRAAHLAIRWTALGPDPLWLRIVAGPTLAVVVWTIACATVGSGAGPMFLFLFAVIDALPQLALWSLLAACGERDLRMDVAPQPSRFGIRELLIALAALCVVMACGRLALTNGENPPLSSVNLQSLLIAALWLAALLPFEAALRLAIVGGTAGRRYVGMTLLVILSPLALIALPSLAGAGQDLLGRAAGYVVLVVGYQGLLLALGVRAVNVRQLRRSKADPS